MPVKIYKLPESEIHMIGEYVAVRWNRRIVTETKKDIMTEEVQTIQRPERVGSPFIDFPVIHKELDATFYLDDDSSVEGGIGPEAAKKIATELLLAVTYIEELGKMEA